MFRFHHDSITSFSFGIIFLNKVGTDTDTLKHEWGHTVQFSLLGGALFIPFVAILSIITNILSGEVHWFNENYYKFPWESTADFFGGVRR